MTIAECLDLSSCPILIKGEDNSTLEPKTYKFQNHLYGQMKSFYRGFLGMQCLNLVSFFWLISVQSRSNAHFFCPKS